jgi:hypothetical protein
VWTFTTVAVADTTPPTVISTVPADNATGVAITGTITATFSEAMDSGTIDATTFTLTGPGLTPVAGAVSYSGTIATFTPTAYLANSTLFTATITTGAKDLAGNALASNKVWTFTTVPVLGPAPVVLGTAGNYVILAKTGISNTSIDTAVYGDIGISPAAETYITGFTLSDVEKPTSYIAYATSPRLHSIGAPVAPAVGSGVAYAADMTGGTAGSGTVGGTAAAMTQAISDMETAYTTANGTPDFTNLLSGILPAGTSLAPGYYTWTTDVSITGNITLSGGPNDVWIFKIDGKLDVSSAVIVGLSGGAQAKNIFWKVATAPGATLGTNSQFKGIILSATQIIMQTGAKLVGRALAQTAVTLDSSTVTQPSP